LRNWKYEAWIIAQGASWDIYPTDDILRTAFWRVLVGPTNQILSALALDADHCSANWAFFKSLFDKHPEIANIGRDESEVLKMGTRLSDMLYKMTGQCSSKRFCVTENGRLGLLPPLVRAGDRIYYFNGLGMPFVLREKRAGEGGEASHALVGTCFIDGLIEGLKGDDLRWETYYLK
jgi:hypothetical protein